MALGVSRCGLRLTFRRLFSSSTTILSGHPQTKSASVHKSLKDNDTRTWNLHSLRIDQCSLRNDMHMLDCPSDHLLSQLNDEQKVYVKVFRMEYDMRAAMGSPIPQLLTDDMLVYLLRYSGTSESAELSREHCWKFWFLKDLRKTKKEMSREPGAGADVVDERPWSLFRHDTRTRKKHYANNLYYAMMNGPHLVIDCSFDDDMTERDANGFASRAIRAYSYIETSPSPFHLHFCNWSKDSMVNYKMGIINPSLDQLPATFSEECFLDLYPRDKLVYICPEARYNLDTVDPNMIHVLGGFHSFSPHMNMTVFARARRLGIKVAKLPLDKYVRWRLGSKHFPVSISTKILNEQMITGDWTKAFQKHVPRSRFVSYNEHES